ncbi:MAG: hypothetical protein EA355_02040 [Rhodobacteraceae bacterium]|nr:MAG: hypothetical protein EA355_02040 [Paracoccaceae bacterium]
MLACAALSACGAPAPPGPPPLDPRIAAPADLARFAFREGRWETAARLYDEALARAEARDDARALIVLGQERALTALRAGDPAAALAFAEAAERNARVRDVAAPPSLSLTAAFALAGLGRWGEAESRAEPAAAAEDPRLAARARFLLGLAAERRGDRARLAATLAGLPETADPELVADRAELAARLARMDRTADAATLFETAADRRRDTNDLRAMARLLADAGALAEAAGARNAAADLFWRAGRSALREGDPAARGWLDRAAALGA